MKKTALTFGLFSLVMVATSFANPTAANNETVEFYGDGTGGQQGLPPRKLDVYSSENQSASDNNKSNSFVFDNQSTGKAIKLD